MVKQSKKGKIKSVLICQIRPDSYRDQRSINFSIFHAKIAE